MPPNHFLKIHRTSTTNISTRKLRLLSRNISRILRLILTDCAVQWDKFNCRAKRHYRFTADSVFISDKTLTIAVLLTERILRLLNIICTKLGFALGRATCAEWNWRLNPLCRKNTGLCFSSKTEFLWIRRRYMNEGRPESKGCLRISLAQVNTRESSM